MREKITALVLLVVLGFYSATIGWRGVELVRDGRPAAVLLGVGVVLIPLVLLVAMVPLVRLARDGSAMMAELRATEAGGGEVDPRAERWRAELEQAESARLAGDRRAEQRHYRAAVRAWRTTREGARQAPEGRPNG